MEINPKAPAVARHQIMIDAPMERVWQLLTNIDHWSAWHPAIAHAKLDGPLVPGTVFRWKSGGLAVVSTLQEIDPPRRIGWTGKALGTRAVHVWMLAPQEQGVLVKTEESFDGWLVVLLKGMMQRQLDRSLQAWLAQLKQTAEKAA